MAFPNVGSLSTYLPPLPLLGQAAPLGQQQGGQQGGSALPAAPTPPSPPRMSPPQIANPLGAQSSPMQSPLMAMVAPWLSSALSNQIAGAMPKLFPQATQPTQSPSKATQPTTALVSRNLISNQFDPTVDQGLTQQEAAAACGPTAALAFARYAGRNPTLSEALSLAKQVGWTPSVGMAGGASEVSLLGKLGVDSQYVAGTSPTVVASEIQAGRPVIIDTPNHYYAIDDYNPQTQQYHVGGSGVAVTGGSEWMTWDQIAQFGNGVSGTIVVTSPSGGGEAA